MPNHADDGSSRSSIRCEGRGRQAAAWVGLATLALLLLGCTPLDPGGSRGVEESPRYEVRTAALTGTHQVIVAYYPIFPRWHFVQPSCPDTLFIGDPVRQFPLLSNGGEPYGNSRDTPEDRDVLRFDFQAMAQAGATVVNPHTFGQTPDLDLFDRIDEAASTAGIQWTPTFEALQTDPAALATATIATIDQYGAGSRLMRVNGVPVFFWYLAPSVTAEAIGLAIGTLRATSGPVMVFLDSQANMPNQNASGGEAINPWFSDLDGFTGTRRASGFYVWVSVFWALKTPAARRQAITSYLDAIGSDYVPVLCTSPSYNEEAWGYQNGVPPTDNCGIGGDRSQQPHYNVDRDLSEWQANLADLLDANPPNAWIYVQAYDEWAEGTTLAPNPHDCFDFLGGLRGALVDSGWLQEAAPYCRPDYPVGYAPTECPGVPSCSAAPPDAGAPDAEAAGDGGHPDAAVGVDAEPPGDGSAVDARPGDARPGPDVQVAPDGGSDPSAESGCGCQAGASTDVGPWLLLLLILVWRRRRG